MPWSWEKGKAPTLIAILLLLIFALHMMVSIRGKGVTYDEKWWIKASELVGRGYGFSTRLTVLQPPLVFSYQAPFRGKGGLLWARALMLPFSLLLGWYVFSWARQLYGEKAGLMALLLYTFNPNILAHGPIVATDVPIASMAFISLYYFREALRGVFFKGALLSGLLFGLALCSKHSGILMVPVFLLWSMGEAVAGKAKRALSLLAMVMVLGILVLLMSHGFSGAFRSLENYTFQSRAFQRLQEIPVIKALPLPIPSPYLVGLDYQKSTTELGHPSFLFGRRSFTGWWYFFLVAFFIKNPLALLGLLVLSFFFFVKEGWKGRKEEAFLLLLPGLFLLSFSAHHNNAGLRFLLPAFPFLFVFCGSLMRKSTKGFSVLLLLLLGWYCGSTLMAYPHYLSYFNEGAGGPEKGYRFLGDSNLDWGQDQPLAMEFIRAHLKDVRLSPGLLPEVGLGVIGANDLQDLYRKRLYHSWLWPMEPQEMIGYSWLVYDLSIDRYEREAHERPEDALTQWALAGAYYYRGQGKKATSALEKTFSLNPHEPLAHYLKGLVALQGENWKEALASLEKAYEADSLLWQALEDKAFVYEVMGLEKEADECMKRALISKTLASYAWPMSFDEKPFVGAHCHVPLLSTGIAAHHNNLGFSYWVRGQLDEAIGEFHKALQLDPYLLACYSNLSAVYEERGLYHHAIKALGAYRALEPTSLSHEQYRIYFGDERLMMGDILEVFPLRDLDILEIKKALEESPDDGELLLKLALLHLKRKEHPQALRALKRLLETEPLHPEAHLPLGLLYAQKGMYQEAQKHLWRAITIDRHNIKAYEALARLLKRLGREEEASLLMKEAREINRLQVTGNRD